MEAFAEFQREGKIRYGGVSNFSVEQMRESLETFPIICNQVGYHLFDFRPEAEVFPFCRQRGLGLMTYGPLAHGLLTGTMNPDTEFAGDDWRRNLTAFGQPLFKGEQFLTNLMKVDDLTEVAAGNGRKVAQLALAWVLSNPAVTVALVGTRDRSELMENIGAEDWVMTEDEREEIRTVVTDCPPPPRVQVPLVHASFCQPVPAATRLSARRKSKSQPLSAWRMCFSKSQP